MTCLPQCSGSSGERRGGWLLVAIRRGAETATKGLFESVSSVDRDGDIRLGSPVAPVRFEMGIRLLFSNDEDSRVAELPKSTSDALLLLQGVR